ncbi:hypothetical protein CK215_15810 [Mesorhizobium sp. WSM3864]|nr:hypothetical protein CK215_15810 [Mesorhizobium sp. WSM3864]
MNFVAHFHDQYGARDDPARNHKFGKGKKISIESMRPHSDRIASAMLDNPDVSACGCRSTSLEECRIKAEYLLTITGGRFTELLQNDSKVLLQVVPAGGMAAA